MSGRSSVSETSAVEGRWQDWQIGNRRDARRSVVLSRVLITLALGAAIAWVAIELLASLAFS